MSNKDLDDVTFDIGDLSAFDINSTLLSSTMNNTLNYTTGINSGPYTITTNGTGYSNQFTNTGQPWVTVGTSAPNALDFKGDANFEGDIKFKGKSLEELFSKIEDRLAILQPDPAKLEKYEALRKAYNHYKLMEKLVQED